MSLKLGTTDINQLYLGSTEINKVYLGATLVYDKTLPPNGLLNNLVSYYKMDTNGSFPDAHGSNNGTINGATYTANGKINGGYIFDGINDTISGICSPINVSGNFTISLWVKYDTTDSNKIITINRTNGFGNGFIGKTAFTNAPGFSIHNGNWNDLAQTTVITGNWYNQVLVREGTSVKLYINGVLDKSITVTGSITNGINNDTFGNYFSDYFDGTFDEYGIWNRALTQTDVTSLYNSGSGLSYDNFTT